MRREPSSRLIALVSLAVIAIALFAVDGCSKDCPTCPQTPKTEHYKGWLYYWEDMPQLSSTGVCQVDMETDSIVGSVRLAETSPDGIDVSSDGRFLAACYWNTDSPNLRTTRIYDAQTLNLITELSDPIMPFFDTEHNLLVGFKPDAGTGTNHLYVLSVPGFERLSKDTVWNFRPEVIDAKHHLIYGPANMSSLSYVLRRGVFCSFDYVNRKLELVQPVDASGDSLWVHRSCLSRDGGTLYFKSEYQSAAVWGTCSVIAWDIKSRQVLWIHPAMYWTGGVTLSPDGKELWMTDPGEPGGNFDTGTIFVLDAATGSYLQGISLYGYDWNPNVCLSASDIVFSPTGEKAYVAANSISHGRSGTVLVVDAKAKKIMKLLSPDIQSGPYNLRIGPKT